MHAPNMGRKLLTRKPRKHTPFSPVFPMMMYLNSRVGMLALPVTRQARTSGLLFASLFRWRATEKSHLVECTFRTRPTNPTVRSPNSEVLAWMLEHSHS